MSPKVVSVEASESFKLVLIFDSGERKVFDVHPYLEKGIFRELKRVSYFKQVKPFFGGVQWSNGQDFSPDTLYLEGKTLGDDEVLEDVELASLVKERLAEQETPVRVNLDDL